MEQALPGHLYRRLGTRRAVALFLLSLFLSLQCFAASHSLHLALHSDAGQPNHECAVSILSHGTVEPADNRVILFAAPEPIVAEIEPGSPAPTPPLLRLPPGRAPPAA